MSFSASESIALALAKLAYFVDIFFLVAAFLGAFAGTFLAAPSNRGLFVEVFVDVAFRIVFDDTDFFGVEDFWGAVDSLSIGCSVAIFFGVFARAVEIRAFNSAFRSATLIVVADLRSRSSP